MKIPAALTPPPGTRWLMLSALLLGLAHPPFHLLLPSFAALVPYVWWISQLPDGDEGRRRALRGGFFMGLVYFLVFAPVGFLRRTFGRNPLKHTARDGSYWVTRTSEHESSLERQF